jgi:hypothetical protein
LLASGLGAALLASGLGSTRAAGIATGDDRFTPRAERPSPPLRNAPLRPGEIEHDWMIPPRSSLRGDTITFGFYEIREDGQAYAVRNGIWTWDHGAPDPLEGWTSVDLTDNLRAYWRHVTEAIWIAEGNPLPWPQMNASSGIAACGSREGESDSLGWVSGLGYGNDWCQRLTSPTLTYSGSGAVGLTFHYFNQTEFAYDYTQVIVKTADVTTVLNPPGFHGSIGIDTLGAITQQTYVRAIQNADFGGGTAARDFNLVIEFQSDGGLSDEDGANGWDAFYGPCGIDDVTIHGPNLDPPDTLSFDFESGLQSWEASKCPGAGSLMGVAPVANYLILDPCECQLAGNVLEFHNDLFQHPGDIDPVAQFEDGVSCAVDREADIGPGYEEYNEISAWWDQYADMPQQNGVYYRPGWSYFPWTPPNVPGYDTWSPPIFGSVWHYCSIDPICSQTWSVGTANGLPATAPRVRFVYRVLSSCANFGIDPCSDVTNFSPLIDNVVIRNVKVPAAPPASFLTGCQFQDGFGQSSSGYLSAGDPGSADISYDTRFGDPVAPAKQGDSLAIFGMNPTASTRWESRLWLRVRRAGPLQEGNQLYNEWKADFLAAKGIQFTPPQSLFTWGYMDSCEAAGQAAKNRFCSQFRDGPSPGGLNLPADPMFSWGADTGEQDEGNEIIPDLALTPGTKIEYFITSNYTCTPEVYYYLPDTTGGNFAEFEILPSFRMDGGYPKYPCVLYIDAFNRGAQYFIEQGLNMALNGAGLGDPVPDPTSWDRYDYLEASSNYKAPIYREWGGNSGFTIPQVLGYRAIMINTGTFDTGATWARDWQGLQQWLTAPICQGNDLVQSLIVDGATVSKIIKALYPSVLSANLGAYHKCDSYFETGCPSEETENDQNFSVRIDPVAGTVFGAGIPSDVFGNWCPPKIPFSVLGTTGSGAGNKNFVKVGSGYATQYAQIINDKLGSPEKYRTVIDDFSYHLLTEREMSVEPDPLLECPADTLSRVTAVYNEIRSALTWTLDVSDLATLGLCVTPTCESEDVAHEQPGNARINHLYPSRPNPFNPRTTIRFSLAQAGAARLVVYDVAGRRVRTLVEGPQEAGAHEVVWDGTNDAGLTVPSGVYWSRLTTEGYTSNRKLVALKR